MTPRPTTRASARAGMPQTWRRAARLSLAAGTLLALTLAGCDPRQAMYFLQPFEPQIAAPCPSLQGKKVVILAHASASAQADYVALDQELTQRIAKALRDKFRRIEIVDQAKVRAWIEEHPTSTDPTEAARAFDCDVVVFLEILEFKIDSPESPGLYAGHSRVFLKAIELKHPENPKGKPVTERPKEPNTLHEAEVETDFPRVQGSLPIDVTVSRTTFRKRFLDIVGAEVSWHFVPHGSGDNVQNTRFTD